MGTTTDLTWGSDLVYLSRLHRSKASFHQMLDLIFELDEVTVRCTQDILRFFGVSVMNLAIGRLIDGSSCDEIDMVIKDLEVEPKVDAMMREFLESCLCTVIRYHVIILLVSYYFSSPTQGVQVMAFSVISISSGLSKESIRMSTARVILFRMIPTTIPSTIRTIDLPIIHDDTPFILTDTPTISPIVPTIPPTAPTIQSRVVASSSPPSSPIPQILPAPPGLPRRPTILVLPGQPIPVGRPYRYDISDSPCDSLTATSERSSRKRCRSPSVPVSLLVRRALSLVHADLSTPPKRIGDSNSVTDLEVSSEDSYEPYVPREANIDECIAYADAFKARGIDDRDVVENAAIKEVESSARGTIEVEIDLRVGPVVDYEVRKSVREDVPDHVTADGAIKSEQRLHRHRITGVDLEVTTMIDRISMLEMVNIRLRGMLDVESQGVDRLQRSLTMPTATRIRMTQDASNKLISKWVDEALKAYDAARNPETEAKIKNEQQDDHVEGDVNIRNGNGNGNGNLNVNNEGVVPVARECTDILNHISFFFPN
nr:hypothetical protein [Tanacetum cinerariifolium]